MVKSLYQTGRQSERPSTGLQLVVAAAPGVPLFTTQEAKDFARIDYTADDTIVDRLVDALTLLAEAETGRAFITQELLAWWPYFNDYAVLPRPPHQTVESVERYDADTGAWTELVLASKEYTLTPGPDYITLRIPRSFTLGASNEQPVRCNFTCGYGDAASDVPTTIRQAVIDSLTHCYQNRGEFQTEQGGQIEAALTPLAKQMLAAFKVRLP